MPFVPQSGQLVSQPSQTSGGFTPSSGVNTSSSPYSLGGFLGNIGSNLGRSISGIGSLAGLGIKAASPLSLPLDILQGKLPGTNEAEASGQLANIATHIPGGLLSTARSFISNPVRYAYQNPVDLASFILPFLGGDIGLAGKAGEVGTAGEEAAVAGGAADVANRIPSVAESVSQGGTGLAGRFARTVIQPQINSDSIGAIAKEEQIAKNVIDITKAGDPYGLAKDIEGLYNKVNSKLSDIIKAQSEKTGVIPLSTGEPGNLLDQLTNNLIETEAGSNNPGLIQAVREKVQNLITHQQSTTPGGVKTTGGEFINFPTKSTLTKDISSYVAPGLDYPNYDLGLQPVYGESPVGGGAVITPSKILEKTTGQPIGFNTTLQGVNDARVAISKLLLGWYKRGAPMITDGDIMNSLLASVHDNIGEFLGQQSPEARELVNVQSNLIPGYKGLYNQVNPSSQIALARGPFSLFSHGIEGILPFLKTIVSRNPNSPFASRLSELIGEPTGGASLRSLPIPLSILNILNQGNQNNPNFGQ